MPRLLKSIRQRGRTFFYRYRVGGRDKSIPLGRDPDLAVTRALGIRRRIKAGLPPMEERPAIFTVEDLVRAWLRDQVAHSRHGRFRLETVRRCEAVLIPFMGKIPVEQVGASALFAYRNHIADLPGRGGRKLSAASVRMYLGDFRAALNHGLNQQVLDRSPVPPRWLPTPAKRAPEVFNREEQSTLRTMSGDYGRVLRLLLDTGMRWSECARAQASDIQGSKLVIRESKSGEPRRVRLSAAVLSECRGRVGRLCPFSDSVSFNKRVRKLSGIARFRSHLCRHTYATEWREAGGSLAGLKAVLGHHDVRVTEKYGTVSEDLVDREVARLEQYRLETGPKTGQGGSRIR
jgi:site-specific recombinase XerD